ncbi:hypothetical protein [Undibacterium sp. Ji22W]|uniref:hypothetical protein n=1 Tax=Undibacterium sp. Ji22W TaxID=3413038 RepID=UPI003BEFD81C
MSFEHKAFEFDYDKFNLELRPRLEMALLSNEAENIKKFIDDNLSDVKDPYEGNVLEESWEDLLEIKDVHQYADFAITKYYDPTNDIGLGDGWERIQKVLLNESESLALIVLGSSVGERSNYFDPGKMGSYFQTPEQVEKNKMMLEVLLRHQHKYKLELSRLIDMFNEIESGKGLYVTF